MHITQFLNTWAQFEKHWWAWVGIGKHVVFRLKPDILCIIEAPNKNQTKPHHTVLKIHHIVHHIQKLSM